MDLSAAANHYSEEDDHEYDDLDIPFEDVLTVRNETLEELKLYWRNDESCIKLINLFPNVKILHSSLKMPENDSFTVQFPQLTKLQEVYLNYRSELIDLNTIQIGPTLLELKFEGQLPPNSLEALSKFAKDHPNIRKLSFMSGFKLLEQQQLICDLKRLENLKIVYMWPDYDQKFIDHVCDCTNLKNIRMSDLPINLSNQIIKRFHTDADRPACDLHTTFEPSNSSFHVAICEDAKTKAPNFFYYGEIAESL